MQRAFEGAGFSFPLGAKTYIMGIVNVTPDSFSDGGRFLSPDAAVSHALSLIEEGADVIDLGAQSTRPGFTRVSAQEEWARLCPVLEALRGLPVPISVDTDSAAVARNALKAGAQIINDVSGGADAEMLPTAAEFGAGIILMHPGDADDLSEKPRDIEQEVHDFLLCAAERAIGAGISPQSICLDPGIGFGKTRGENLLLLSSRAARPEGFAWLVGASRKRVTDCPAHPAPASGRLGGTIAAHTLAQLAGADFLRVHDVKQAVQAAALVDEAARQVRTEE